MHTFYNKVQLIYIKRSHVHLNLFISYINFEFFFKSTTKFEELVYIVCTDK